LSFQPASSPPEREKAIQEWREWLKQHEGTFKKRFGTVTKGKRQK